MNKVTIPIDVGAAGWFTISAVKDGRVCRSKTFSDPMEIGPFKNLILNGGMDRLATNTGNQSLVFGNFYVGTGTVPPAATNNQLTTQVGGATTASPVRSAGVAPDYYAKTVFSGISAIGAFGNVNLTEIGIGGSSTTLFSRALIADSAGNPVSFPINDDEQLQVSYELRIYPPLTDSSHTVNVSGSRTVTVRAIGVASSAFWGVDGAGVNGPAIGITNPPGGVDWFTGGLGSLTATAATGAAVSTPTGGRTITDNPYSSGSFSKSGRISWNSASANSTTLRTNVVGFRIGTFQVQYDPPISKDSTQTMYLDYQLSWSRR